MASVTRTSSKGRSARRASIVARLLTTVEALLDEGESYTEISVERMITGAQISRSTFYVYFDDKGALLLALAEDVVAKLIIAAQTWWELPADATRRDVEQTLHGIVETYCAHAAMWAALIDAAAYDAKVRASFQLIVGRTTKELEAHIREGQKGGFVRPDLDPKRTAAWLTWMTERGLYQLTPGANAREVEKLCQAQTAIVWYTLYEGAPSRS